MVTCLLLLVSFEVCHLLEVLQYYLPVSFSPLRHSTQRHRLNRRSQSHQLPFLQWRRSETYVQQHLFTISIICLSAVLMRFSATFLVPFLPVIVPLILSLVVLLLPLLLFQFPVLLHQEVLRLFLRGSQPVPLFLFQDEEHLTQCCLVSFFTKVGIIAFALRQRPRLPLEVFLTPWSKLLVGSLATRTNCIFGPLRRTCVGVTPRIVTRGRSFLVACVFSSC